MLILKAVFAHFRLETLQKLGLKEEMALNVTFF